MGDRCSKHLTTQEFYDGLTADQQAAADRCAEGWSYRLWERFSRLDRDSSAKERPAAGLEENHTSDSSAGAVRAEELNRSIGFGGVVKSLFQPDVILDWSRRLTPMFSDLGVHGVLFALDRLLFQIGQEVELYTRQQLAEHLGSIAEYFGASTATVFGLEGERLQAVVTHNTRVPQLEATLSDRTGIVAHVARTRRGYYSNDVGMDPLYRMDVEETQSEMAIPILFSQKLLGCVNLECRERAAFNPAHVEELQAAAGALIPHLLILESLQSGGPAWVPWHHEMQGWDLSYLFKRICHAVAQSFDRDVSKATIWYMDKPKAQLFVYATSGYDIEYRCDRVLPLESFIGNAVCSPRGEVHVANPVQDPIFVRKDKAARMGIARSLACPIHPPGKDAGHGISALAVYFNLAEHDTPSVRESMRQIADALGSLARAFEGLRRDVALARLHHLQYTKPRSSESDFEVLLAFLQEVFAADGGSIFARQAHDDQLFAVATTGLVSAQEGPAAGERSVLTVGSAGPVAYDMESEESYTVFMAKNPGVVLRFSNLLDRQECGLPPNLPKRTLLRYRESFPPRHDYNRRFLGVGIEMATLTTEKDPLGVIRILRRPHSKPFTLCDERLLLTLASSSRKQFLDWRRVECVSPRFRDNPPIKPTLRASAGPSSVQGFSRLLRPIPVTHSSRTLIEELLADLFACYRPYGVSRARLLIRHHSGAPNVFRVHAVYTEPRREIAIDERPIPAEDDLGLSLLCSRVRGTLRRSVVTFDQASTSWAAGLRAPVRTWTQHGLIDCVLALDFSQSIRWCEYDIDPAFYASCRLAAILGTTDPLGASEAVIDPEVRSWDWKTILDLVKMDLPRFGLEKSSIQLGPLPNAQQWVCLDRKTHRDETSYGVRVDTTKRRLAIPLRLGSVPVGYFLCQDHTADSPRDLHQALSNVTAFWTHLSFSRCGNWKVDSYHQASRPQGRLWLPQPHMTTPSEEPYARRESLFTEIHTWPTI